MNDTAVFRCPICGDDFIKKEKSLICKNGHCFDISSAGYVNLLPVQKMHSKIPGDTKEMVLSRRKFLSNGYYEPLKNEICNIIKEFSEEGFNIFDSGCGEGYYTSGMVLPKNCVYGIDISKIAIEKASKAYKDVSFAVASVYDLPIKNGSVDILCNIFAPLALSEFCRILKKDGIFLYVVPAEKHLFNMKSILYQKPYENTFSTPEYDGFEYIESKKLSFEILIDNTEDINALFNMTPYFWRTPKDGAEKLSKLSILSDTAEFYIHLMRRTN